MYISNEAVLLYPGEDHFSAAPHLENLHTETITQAMTRQRLLLLRLSSPLPLPRPFPPALPLFCFLFPIPNPPSSILFPLSQPLPLSPFSCFVVALSCSLFLFSLSSFPFFLLFLFYVFLNSIPFPRSSFLLCRKRSSAKTTTTSLGAGQYYRRFQASGGKTTRTR